MEKDWREKVSFLDRWIYSQNRQIISEKLAVVFAKCYPLRQFLFGGWGPLLKVIVQRKLRQGKVELIDTVSITDVTLGNMVSQKFISGSCSTIKGTVSPDIRLYFRFWKIKSVLSAGPLTVFTFLCFVVP